MIRRVLVLALGWIFIALGIAGLFLPVLQGILFLLSGLALLSVESRTARRILARLRARFPALAQRLDEAERRARALFARLTGRDQTEG